MQLKVTKIFQLFDDEVIEKYSEKTGWFDSEKPLSMTKMYEILGNAGFSREQALVMIASLGLIGVNFVDDTLDIND